MQVELIALLMLYLAVEGIEQFLLILNLKHLERHGAEIPPVFAEFVNSATLTKMRDYTVAHGRLDLLAALFSIGITCIFLFGGALNWFNNLIAKQGWSPVISGVVFFMALVYAATLLKIPFSLYTTFSLEKKFGFTRQTVGLWVQDLVKSVLLNTLLLGFLFAMILWLITALPDLWWLAGWLFVLLFSIFLLYLSPYVIEPIFNKFSPIENESLEQQIRDIMSRVGLQINRVFTMDASKRSGHTNAYFTGIGHVKRIVLFDTLLANHGDDEIIAILAHEAGHWKKKHLLKMLVFNQAFALVGFYAAYRLVAGTFLTELFRLDVPSMHARLLLAAFIGSLVLFPLKPLLAYLSRRHEVEADNFAVQLTRAPGSMAKGLIKLGKDNLANLHPHPWYAAVHYSHPPLVQRVERILNIPADSGV
ncbi:MAG: M48 family metallopeptidase [Desulfobulbales bacterium]|nr:M48 family metallopeptidase [Desulfobulbales bacterium]